MNTGGRTAWHCPSCGRPLRGPAGHCPSCSASAIPDGAVVETGPGALARLTASARAVLTAPFRRGAGSRDDSTPGR